MEVEQKTENIELLLFALKRPKIFSIQNIEDYFLFFKGYCIGREDTVVVDFLNSFEIFIKNKFHKSLKNLDFVKIIRLYSADDSHSLELLKNLMDEFLGSVPKVLI